MLATKRLANPFDDRDLALNAADVGPIEPSLTGLKSGDSSILYERLTISRTLLEQQRWRDIEGNSQSPKRINSRIAYTAFQFADITSLHAGLNAQLLLGHSLLQPVVPDIFPE